MIKKYRDRYAAKLISLIIIVVVFFFSGFLIFTGIIPAGCSRYRVQGCRVLSAPSNVITQGLLHVLLLFFPPHYSNVKNGYPTLLFFFQIGILRKYQFLNGFLIWHGTFQLQEKWPHKTKCKWYWIRHLGARVKWFLTSYCPLSTPRLAHPKYPFSTWEYTQSALFSHLPFSLFNTQLFVFFFM